MQLTEDEWALLDDNSDDWYGLWEVDWWFNSVTPDWSFPDRAEFVASLVRRGLLEVFFGRIGVERPPLQTDEAERALAVAANWQPFSDIEKAVYHISTSEAGIAALRENSERPS